MALSDLFPRYTILFKIFIKYYLSLIVICIILFLLYKYVIHPIFKYYNNKNNNNKNNNNKNNNNKNNNNKHNSKNKNENKHLDENNSKNKNENKHLDENNSKNKNENKHLDENNSKNETNNKPKNNSKEEQIHHLFWTGGYDSTFRLCEMLINERKIVQPIYVDITLDNDCQTEETCNKLWVRRNRKQEKIAMKNIRNKLNKKFKYTTKSLLPTLIVKKNIDDKKFNYNFEKKFNKENLWPKKRKIHQYLFLSKYTYYYKEHVDIGVLGIHKKSKFYNFLKMNLTESKDKYGNINYEIKDKTKCLSYLRFPLFKRNKTMLLGKSIKYNFDDVLKLSWSCWFPNNADNKPCGKCPMCKERVVLHPNIEK